MSVRLLKSGPKHPAAKIAFTLLLLSLTSFFFVGRSDSSMVVLPWLRDLWNLAHIGFFALTTLAVHWFRAFRSSRDVLIYLGVVVVVSVLIEAAQMLVGRDLSILDLLRNVTGAVVALLLLAKQHLHRTLLYLFLCFLFADLTGFAVTAYTDAVQQTRKPVIENFENAFVFARWRGNIERSSELVTEGDYSGKITLRSTRFSGVSLEAPLTDWSTYNLLTLDVHNPHEQSIFLTLRIDDVEHQHSGLRYSDRFNRTIDIPPGWSNIEVALEDIINAPESRALDITQIDGFRLFVADATEGLTLHIDNIKLINR